MRSEFRMTQDIAENSRLLVCLCGWQARVPNSHSSEPTWAIHDEQGCPSANSPSVTALITPEPLYAGGVDSPQGNTADRPRGH